METRRFWNPSLPQTLQSAVILCYLNGFFLLIDVVDAGSWQRAGGNARIGALATVLWLAILLCTVFGGYLIANTQKLGWQLATGGAVANIVLRVFILRSLILDFDILGLMFDAALVVLLLHVQSREHQRLWFE